MSERFAKIPAAEQHRILQAALQEFADKGYRRASTNTIVKAAGIPKGTLFYFFGSKRNLFFQVLDSAIDVFKNYMEEEKGEPPSELFARLLHREQVKLRFAAAHPLLYRFFAKVFLDIPEEIMEELGGRFNQYSAASADDLTADLDRTTFREGVDVEDAVKMIHVLLEGIFARYSPRLKETAPEEMDATITEISAECQLYFRMIQKGIYKDP